MTQECRTVCFSGNVQGVGFRYTAIRTARHYEVTGHVRNTPDGQVECVIEGATDQIDAFIADLSGQMRPYIHSQHQQTAAFTGRYSSFDVRF